MNTDIVAYVMANDNQIFWLEPFIKSFKRHNDIKLFLIPFDSHIQETSLICEKYNVEIVDDKEFFESCDEQEALWANSQCASKRWYKERAEKTGYFRKFYTLIRSGFRRSIFLDCDIIITKKFDEKFYDQNYDVMYFCETGKEYCYPSCFIKSHPEETNIHHYNTGGFCCKQEIFSMNDFKNQIATIINNNIDTLSHGNDQPIINMISIIKKLKMTSNHSVLWPCSGDGLQESNYMIHWAGGNCKKQFPMKEYYDQYC